MCWDCLTRSAWSAETDHSGGPCRARRLVWSKKSGLRRPFPTGLRRPPTSPAALPPASPGGGRRKVALLAQGCRIRRACRRIRISLGGTCGPLQASRRLVRAVGSGMASGAVRRGAFLVSSGHSKRWHAAGWGRPRPWRERWARGRAYRGGKWRARRGFWRGGAFAGWCAGAWSGGARGWVQHVAVSCAGRALETLFLLAALAGVWARSGKKGGRAGGRGPLYACRGTEKNFFCQRNPFYQ